MAVSFRAVSALMASAFRGCIPFADFAALTSSGTEFSSSTRAAFDRPECLGGLGMLVYQVV